MNYLEQLVALIPPPAGIEPHTEAEWVELETKIGTPLPSDYKRLINRYGSGTFCSLLHIYSPLSIPNNFATGEEWLRSTHEMAVESSIYALGDLTLFPEPGGLFNFANDEVGGFLFWRTEGVPEDWTLVIAGTRLDSKQEFSMSLTEFILRFAQNDTEVEKYEYDMPIEPTFEPVSLSQK